MPEYGLPFGNDKIQTDMRNSVLVVLASLIQAVFFCPDINCPRCAEKIGDIVGFEKGVKDLSIDIDRKQVTIKFNSAKTDTLALGKALAKIGYPAEVVEFKEIKK